MTPRLLLPSLLLSVVPSLAAQDAQPNWSSAQAKAAEFLRKQQKDGVFTVSMGGRSVTDPGFSGLALAALQTKPESLRTDAEKQAIDAGCKWLLGQQNEDGSFGQRMQNYTTCAAVMALAKWHDDAKKPALQKAQKYVLAIQYAESTKTAPSDVEYGGIGYGSKGERADLSNLQFAIAALKATGLEARDQAFARAVVFLQRTQNLKSGNDLSGKLEIKGADNKPVKMTAGDDGGAVYYPGESPAGYVDLPDGTRTPRSYGSMTYALLKTYTLCGVDGKDPRVQAAVKWIGANWTVADNPGFDGKEGPNARYQGLFYYYLLLAQALDAAKVDKVTVTKDTKTGDVDWRADLKKQLESMQRADGAWVNDKSDRWYEGSDFLCTCYALLALEHCN